MWEGVKGWSSREIVTCCDRPSTATEAPNQSPAFTTLAKKLGFHSNESLEMKFLISQVFQDSCVSCTLNIWIWRRQWSEFKQVVAVEYAGGACWWRGGAILVEHRLVRRRGHQTANFLFRLFTNFLRSSGP